MLSLQTLAFVLVLLLSTYLTVLCSTPPNPTPARVWKKDALGYYASSSAANIRRILITGFTIFHVALILALPGAEAICPHLANLNALLFKWSTYTLTCFLLIICIGAPLRFMSFQRLGKNFTFNLAQPDRLTTTGIYRYVQHPSYTGQVVVLGTNSVLFLRWDGVLACWIPETVSATLNGWGYMAFSLAFLLMAWKLAQRVKDEETILRETFGHEWEKWHHSAKRFIPGVF
ncbi:uncharacterized protein BKA55DRAFT_576725 [Fusarium redolens]|uniref:Protein-S-isoprenylcysteine O-methyltransferase n=1 Tax=Fusarium redolens TaxID=48865 RepID=A0A9P9GJZ6_FUSRE|nr:uncharacterized protein BKA55DRAFT_576725 [Fusarium redolens]KAH7239897.1 hypothetical protein BKA55DRAFT_576725 [Fusarium redolens]